MAYRVLQLTNPAIGVVPAPTATVPVPSEVLIPLGSITRKRCCGNAGQNTFAVSTTGANTVTLNETGYYHITYTASLVATAAGLVTIALLQNGFVLTTASATATAGGTVNITLDYVVRVLPNCSSVTTNVPSTIQIGNLGVALTSGTSNLVIEKVC